MWIIVAAYIGLRFVPIAITILAENPVLYYFPNEKSMEMDEKEQEKQSPTSSS